MLEEEGGEDTLVHRLDDINAPVLLKGALSDWKDVQKWTKWSYLLENFGDIVLPRTIVTDKLLDVAQGEKLISMLQIIRVRDAFNVSFTY